MKRLEEHGDLLPEIEVLTEEPTREKFFAMLPDFDWEERTPDGPRWAWELHPWYAYLEITEEEVDAYWNSRQTGVPR